MNLFLGNAREPVRDVLLEDISVGKAHIAKSFYENALDIREKNIHIGAILPALAEQQWCPERY